MLQRGSNLHIRRYKRFTRFHIVKPCFIILQLQTQLLQNSSDLEKSSLPDFSSAFSPFAWSSAVSSTSWSQTAQNSVLPKGADNMWWFIHVYIYIYKWYRDTLVGKKDEYGSMQSNTCCNENSYSYLAAFMVLSIVIDRYVCVKSGCLQDPWYIPSGSIDQTQ